MYQIMFRYCTVKSPTMPSQIPAGVNGRIGRPSQAYLTELDMSYCRLKGGCGENVSFLVEKCQLIAKQPQQHYSAQLNDNVQHHRL